ncbi:hypothetical protein EMIT0P258_190063 [Pseudomonas sp. IT-P258]
MVVAVLYLLILLVLQHCMKPRKPNVSGFTNVFPLPSFKLIEIVEIFQVKELGFQCVEIAFHMAISVYKDFSVAPAKPSCCLRST